MSKHIDPVILLVDDNSQNLQVLGSMLKENGYKPLATKSGNEALSFMQSTQPDLILLDIMMPVMNGIEVCNHLKAKDITKDIPIIFITALDDTLNKIHAFEAGGVDYITKPFQKEEVLARIKAHLTIRTQQKQLKEQNLRLKQEIIERKRAEEEIKVLRGIIPICSKCKKIRDDKGYWNQIETYIENHSQAQFSHGLCEKCSDELYGNQKWYKKSKNKKI